MNQHLPARAPTSTTAAVSLGERRREATLGVLNEVVDAGRIEQPVIALRTYGPGCLAVAVGGALDDAALGRLRALLDDPHIGGLSLEELVIDLSGIHACAPGLVRLLTRLRSRRLGEGCRVELRNPPEVLAPELEQADLTDAFTVDGAARGPVEPESALA